MNLKLLDATKAAVYGVPQEDTTTDAIIADYEARGWKAENVMSHIQAAIDVGVYARETIYPERTERVIKQK